MAPEVFPTGIDVLHLQTGRLDNEASRPLIKFWDKFEKQTSQTRPWGFLHER
ncbi:MAG: hypothetical protein ACLU93_00865 [Streptococcus sp.]